MLIDFIPESIRHKLRMVKYALKAVQYKILFYTTGRSRVSESCQIPYIVQKYVALGMPKNHGIFVEIGSFDGDSFSNTSFLADQGWKGVYVEPISEFCDIIAARHFLNDISISRVAITNNDGVIDIEVDGALSSANKLGQEAHTNLGWSSHVSAEKIRSVPTKRLTQLLEEQGAPTNLDLMVIDVEGGEETIVEQLINSNWRPRVLIVELCDVHPEFHVAPTLQDSHERTRANIVKSGYSTFYCDHINSIFYLIMEEAKT